MTPCAVGRLAGGHDRRQIDLTRGELITRAAATTGGPGTAIREVSAADASTQYNPGADTRARDKRAAPNQVKAGAWPAGRQCRRVLGG